MSTTLPTGIPFPAGYPNIGTLQPGDQIPTYRPNGNPNFGAASFANYSIIPVIAGVALTAGQPLCMLNNGEVGIANSTSLANATCIGFCSANTPIGQNVAFANTVITIATLVVGDIYYLSATSGVLSNIPPITGQYSTKVGIAITPNTLLINIDYPQLVP